MTLETLDIRLIRFFRYISIPLARFGLFVIFFWFGILKVLGSSPANPLVGSLLAVTLPFISPETFFVLFGIFEMCIGLLFIIPKMERVVIPLLLIHLSTTCMPLFLLPTMTWQSMMVPTLEGQYIIKNLALVAAAVVIAAHLHPLEHRRHNV